MSDANRTVRRLHAHGVHAFRMWFRVVLGVPGGVDTRLHGYPLVWIKNMCHACAPIGIAEYVGNTIKYIFEFKIFIVCI